MKKDFESIAHTGDIMLRAYGETKKELFRHALIGMFQAVSPQAPGCQVENDRVICDALPIHHDMALESSDSESLLVDFLSEALYLSDVHNEAYLDAIIYELTDVKIRAAIQGVSITGFAVVEIKAVTYHNLHIRKEHNLWVVDIVFDI